MFYAAGSFPANTKPDRSFFPERGALYPYTKSTQIYVCPSDAVGQRTGNSYSANYCAFGSSTSPPIDGFRPGKSIASFDAVGSTAQWMLLGEEGIPNGTPADQNSTDDAYFNYGVTNVFAQRHFDGSNILFMDGHVKWHRNEKITGSNFVTGGVAAGGFTNRGDGCPGP
jgi:prepilin-type processing-associated H-X9-DG protein